jgi:hypothetical protein
MNINRVERNFCPMPPEANVNNFLLPIQRRGGGIVGIGRGQANWRIDFVPAR